MGYRSVCPFCGSHGCILLLPLKFYQNGSKMRAGDPHSGVNNFFVNTIVTALQGSDWERLLERCAPVFFDVFFTCLTPDVVIQNWGERDVSFADRSEHIRASTQ